MNCLLLLIILFCCNGNGNCGSNGCGSRECRREPSCKGNCNMRREQSHNGCAAKEEARERMERRRECDCDAAPGMHTHTPMPMPRTQFPYLDVEPRTCGCEEKSES